MNCKVCKKRAYLPKYVTTMGGAMDYLVRRGWAAQQEHWHSSLGQWRDEWHLYCPKHTGWMGRK
jgi:hypothetical protein